MRPGQRPTPTDQALTRFLPWAAGTDDLTAWANEPPPNPDIPEPDTTTESNARSADPRTGPAP